MPSENAETQSTVEPQENVNIQIQGETPEKDTSEQDEFKKVLLEELNFVEKRRELVHQNYQSPIQNDQNLKLQDVRCLALKKDMIGLAVSGGGIRSGTFTLGILQALASLKLLNRIDYFSSVSGGGYMAGWFAAWVQREQNSEIDSENHLNPSPLANVEQQLNPNRCEQAKANRISPDNTPQDKDAEPKLLDNTPQDKDAEPIEHLRAYSRYLTPRMGGFFSLDNWSLVTIYQRNLFINWLIFLPIIIGVIVLIRFITRFFTFPKIEDWHSWLVFGVYLFLILIVELVFRRKILARRNKEMNRSNTNNCSKNIRYKMRLSDRFVPWVLILISLFGLWVIGGNPGIIVDNQNQKTDQLSRLPKNVIDLIKNIEKKLGFSENDPSQNMDENVYNYSTAAILFAYLALWLKVIYSLLFKRKEISLLIINIIFLICASFLIFWSKELFKYQLLIVLGVFYLIIFSGFRILFRSKKLNRFSEKLFRETFIVITWGICLGLLNTLWINNLTYPEKAKISLENQGKPKNNSSVAKDSKQFFPKNDPSPPKISIQDSNNFLKNTHPAMMVTLGPPSFLLMLALVGWLEVVLLGYVANEIEREYRSRLLGNFMVAGIAWLIICTCVLFVPNWLSGHEFSILSSTLGSSTLGLAFLKKPFGLIKEGINSGWGRYVIAMLSSLFLLAIFVSVTILVNAFIPGMNIDIDYNCPGNENGSLNLYPTFEMADGAENMFYVLLCMFVLSLFFISIIDVNIFSLHALYCNRLTRAYLGASCRKENSKDYGTSTGVEEPTRYPDPETGFAFEDDLPLSTLKNNSDQSKKYTGPFHIFNTTINLVSGVDLGYQDRKGDSFFLSSLYCGSKVTGYAKLYPDIINPEDPSNSLTLGQAITTSGAAIDPNMGFMQSSAFTALLVLLNLRLGMWIQNPKMSNGHWVGATPADAWPLFKELTGNTNDSDEFVHLSDGGHFDNSGVYELINRRCRYIIYSECSEDLNGASGNLAVLIRNVRRDFGIRIDIDTAPLQPDQSGISTSHVAIGTIHYDDFQSQVHERDRIKGILVFIRGNLTGDEPPDILNYASVNKSFPHDPTLNQFFNEEMFESYRELGYHIGRSVFEKASKSVLLKRPQNNGEDDSLKVEEWYKSYNQVLFYELKSVNINTSRTS